MMVVMMLVVVLIVVVMVMLVLVLIVFVMMVVTTAGAVLVMLFMVVMVVMVVLVLGSCFVAVEPGHIVIVVLELLCKLDVEIAGVDAVLVYARNGNLKAADRKRGELFA